MEYSKHTRIFKFHSKIEKYLSNYIYIFNQWMRTWSNYINGSVFHNLSFFVNLLHLTSYSIRNITNQEFTTYWHSSPTSSKRNLQCYLSWTVSLLFMTHLLYWALLLLCNIRKRKTSFKQQWNDLKQHESFLKKR